MGLKLHVLDSRLSALEERVAALRASAGGSCEIVRAMERFGADSSAARFHLRGSDRNNQPTLVAILGGTGTGKSTLVNRLLERDVTATSFRRTYTAGAVAIARDPDVIPQGWLRVETRQLSSAELPARGEPDSLAVISLDHPITQAIALIDTPDLDGDQPAHHAQADRVFRWAQAVLFLVTPEKYQMTELRPYYRLAARYGIPAIFVMNKVEEQAVVDDYAVQLAGASVAQTFSPVSDAGDPTSEDSARRARRATRDVQVVYAIPRDDAAYEPPENARLDSLRRAIASLKPSDSDAGLTARVSDLMGRLRDQIIAPLRDNRREVDRLTRQLREMGAAAPGIDVNPLTRQLQRRLQQRSVLYLMGPGRILDRVRQVPGLLVRLPRTTWDLLRHGALSRDGGSDLPKDFDRRVPDFRGMLMREFVVVQSRIDDAIRSSAPGQRWAEWSKAGYSDAKLSPDEAGKIADEELADLREWLEKRWNGTPRDTAVLKKLLSVLPGAEKLTRWSEAAPYLLAIIVATHGAFFGHLDLMILGGFSLATWLTEKLSNEVASRTRLTNTRIADRFTRLARQQIERSCQWLARQAPTSKDLDDLEQRANQVQEQLQ